MNDPYLSITWTEYDSATDQLITTESDGVSESITLETVNRATFAAGLTVACLEC